MFYDLLRAKDKGALVPKYRLAFIQPTRGRMLVSEEYVAELGRHSTVARLLDPVSGARLESVPPLHDVTLLRWSSDLVSLTGFEHLPDDFGQKFYDYSQTWLLTPAQD